MYKISVTDIWNHIFSGRTWFKEQNYIKHKVLYVAMELVARAEISIVAIATTFEMKTNIYITLTAKWISLHTAGMQITVVHISQHLCWRNHSDRYKIEKDITIRS